MLKIQLGGCVVLLEQPVEHPPSTLATDSVLQVRNNFEDLPLDMYIRCSNRWEQ